MSFAKALAVKYPRGVNFISEADFFYPLPSKIEDWYPPTKKPAHTKPPPSPPMPMVAKTPRIDYVSDDIQYVQNTQQYSKVNQANL